MLNDDELKERIAERLGKAPEDEESRQQNLPVDTVLMLSSRTCALSGDPPFVVTIRDTCKTNRPIWALVSLDTPWSHRVQVRDPARNYRKIGPSTDWIGEDVSMEERDLEDTKLVRLVPGENSELSFTFSTNPRADGLRSNDMRPMVAGNTYHITLGQRRWRWMFEDEMPPDIIDAERRAMLSTRTPMEWKPDCIEQYEATT